MRKLGFTPRVALTLVAGLAGALLAGWLDFPGGSFTGALLATAGARLLDAPLDKPPEWLQVSARIVLGLTIGAMVTVETLRSIVQSLVPVALVVLAMIGLGLAIAEVISRLTGMHRNTALCAATPGVFSAMVALADDLDADPRIVASMHLVRLMSILLSVPLMVRALSALTGRDAVPAPAAAAGAGASLAPLCALLALGLAAGFLARRFKVPAGDLLAGLALAAVLNPAWLHLADLPESWRLFAQWIVGAGVGATVTRSTLRDFRPYAVAGGLMTAFLIVAGLGLAWILAQVTSLDLVTCIIGTSPGGAAALIILADSLGANTQLVAAMHVARQIILMLAVPFLAKVASRQAPAKSLPEL